MIYEVFSKAEVRCALFSGELLVARACWNAAPVTQEKLRSGYLLTQIPTRHA